MSSLETGTAKKSKPARNGGWLNRIGRTIRYKLHIPMIRSPHPPEFTARGVMVGMVWAMLPLVGIQMICVFVTWVITRKLFKWDFSLANGLAWTWITNVFTVIPAYYLFYVTGLYMLGDGEAVGGYDQFANMFRGIGHGDLGFWQKAMLYTKTLLIGWGLPLTIGSLPWAISSGIISYYLSLRFVRAYKERRAERMAQAVRPSATTLGGEPPKGQ